MRLVRLALLGLVLAGCQPPRIEKMAGQDAAVEIIWNRIYGETVEPPTIEWVYQDHLNCHPNETGLAEGFEDSRVFSGACLGGEFFERAYHIKVAWWFEQAWLSQTAIAHELLHAHLLLRFGDGDGDHGEAEWYYLLPRAEGAIINEGY